MVQLSLNKQTDLSVREELESLLGSVREKEYTLESEPIISELITDLQHLFEGRKPLIKSIKQAASLELSHVTSAGDFCCFLGSGTRELAKEFPEANVYGFDIIPFFIEYAQKRTKDKRIHFLVEDIYNIKNGYAFDIVTFNGACGPMADRIIEWASESNTKIIAGKFCCYHTIPMTLPKSKSPIRNVYLQWIGGINRATERVYRNYIRNQDVKAYASYSYICNFLQRSAGVTPEEWEKIAAMSADTKAGTKIIDLNRVMKLLEHGYTVWLDEHHHILVAKT